MRQEPAQKNKGVTQRASEGTGNKAFSSDRAAPRRQQIQKRQMCTRVLTDEFVAAEMSAVANEHLLFLLQGQRKVVLDSLHCARSQLSRDSMVLDVERAQLDQGLTHISKETGTSNWVVEIMEGKDLDLLVGLCGHLLRGGSRDRRCWIGGGWYVSGGSSRHSSSGG